MREEAVEVSEVGGERGDFGGGDRDRRNIDGWDIEEHSDLGRAGGIYSGKDELTRDMRSGECASRMMARYEVD